MIFALQFLLAVVIVAPLALALRAKAPIASREAALALHRGQLVELDRERDDGRLPATEYQGARLEVERRLLAADALPAPTLTGNAKPLILTLLVLLPFAAFVLYLPGATPNVPSQPYAEVQSKLTDLITKLRAHLAAEDPTSVDASQGQAYLAEALSEQAGTVTPEAQALFTQSLANAPANADWRALDEQRLGVTPATP